MPEQKVTIFDAWKIALGVAGTLAGVSIVLILLAIIIRFAVVQPSVAGGLTDQERYDLLAKSRADDEKLLATYGWIDPAKGVVRIPVEEAMRKVIEEHK